VITHWFGTGCNILKFNAIQIFGNDLQTPELGPYLLHTTIQLFQAAGHQHKRKGRYLSKLAQVIYSGVSQ
jgi:hypothetical protein